MLEHSAMAKRPRFTENTTMHSGKKTKAGCIRPICEENKVRHDVILCEGDCDAWLHHRCASLSKPAFLALQSLPDLLPTPP